MPAVEIEERGGKMFVRAELPGVTKDDVKVEVRGDNGVLEVSVDVPAAKRAAGRQLAIDVPDTAPH